MFLQGGMFLCGGETLSRRDIPERLAIFHAEKAHQLIQLTGRFHMDSLALEASSTSAVFCCVIPSICRIALFTCAIPGDGSCEVVILFLRLFIKTK
jgi:hypothetical protein